MQMNMVASRLEIDWPSPLKGALEAQDTIVGAGANMSSLSCLLEQHGRVAYLKTLVVALLPVALGGLIIAALYCSYLWTKRKYQRGRSGDSPKAAKRSFFRQSHNLALAPLDPLWDETEEELRERFVGYFATAVGVVMFLIHPTVSAQAMLLFACKALGSTANERWYLIADMGEQCWTTRHLAWVFLLGVPMMVFFVFGYNACWVSLFHVLHFLLSSLCCSFQDPHSC